MDAKLGHLVLNFPGERTLLEPEMGSSEKAHESHYNHLLASRKWLTSASCFSYELCPFTLSPTEEETEVQRGKVHSPAVEELGFEPSSI